MYQSRIRIIGGTHKSRQVAAPGNLPVRPTTDFAKEALFNILQHQLDFETISVLDLFAGTGNISYEFASRGCRDITCVESNFKCYSFIKKTAAEFGFNQINVIKNDVFSFIKTHNGRYDLIFADPPFELDRLTEIPGLVFAQELLTENGRLIVEHGPRTTLEQNPCFVEQRSYGNVNFSIFKRNK